MNFYVRRLPATAFQWFKNGDHPEDDIFRPYEDTGKIPDEPREGLVVRYFRHPLVKGESLCPYCADTLNRHGWVDNYKNSFYNLGVCPGSYIVHDPNHAYALTVMREEKFNEAYRKL